jgi:hypothetical protein
MYWNFLNTSFSFVTMTRFSHPLLWKQGAACEREFGTKEGNVLKRRILPPYLFTL